MSNLANLTKQAVEVRKSKAQSDDRPKAEFWINIGYVTEDEEGNEIFISTPVGIALDTQNVSDKSPFAEEQQDLLQQLLNHANKLDAGEHIDLNPESLTIRLQRISNRTHASRIKTKTLVL